MSDVDARMSPFGHNHVFLGEGHAAAERRTWAVIWLCGAMMALEIAGGLLFGSIALVADGLHMSTHAGALLLAALAYTYSRRHAHDPRYTFGTGKLGDLAGFTSAIVLAMIALLIGYESVSRLWAPVDIHFTEALPIAAIGLLVNIGSAWLLSGGGHHHHDHAHADHGHAHAEEHALDTVAGTLVLSVFEASVPPVFRLQAANGRLGHEGVTIETQRPDGARQIFTLADRSAYLESLDSIPEPHAFIAHVRLVSGQSYPVLFEEHAHWAHAAHRDNNMRGALIHVMADAAVSVLVIVGLLLARAFGWLWMDALAGIIGAGVIASWAYGLATDTGAILLDMTPDATMAETLRQEIEADGDSLTDLHVWRLGPGHLGAILSIRTARQRSADFYRSRLGRFKALSHITIEVGPMLPHASGAGAD